MSIIPFFTSSGVSSISLAEAFSVLMANVTTAFSYLGSFLGATNLILVCKVAETGTSEGIFLHIIRHTIPSSRSIAFPLVLCIIIGLHIRSSTKRFLKRRNCSLDILASS
jgi:hypothetical protein